MSHFNTLRTSVRALVTDEELSEALQDSGLRPEAANDDTSYCRGLLIGLRSVLDPSFVVMLSALGIDFDDFAEDGTVIPQGAAIAKLILNRRANPTPAGPAVAVPGLAGLGSLDEAPAFVQRGREADAEADYGEDEFDEPALIVARPVDVSVEFFTNDTAIATTAAETLVTVFAEMAGAYEVRAFAAAQDNHLVSEFAAMTDSEEWLCALPNGTAFFDNSVKVGDEQIRVIAKVSGDLDPENPPLQINETIAEILNKIEADFGEAVPAVESLVLMLERLDGQDLNEAQLEAPLRTAVAALTERLGPITVTGTEVGDRGAVRFAHLRLDGEGNLDARGLRIRAVGFTGTLPFAGIGRVKACVVEA